MNSIHSQLFVFCTLATLVCVHIAGITTLAEVAGESAGFCKLTSLGNSDTLVSIPFSRPAAASGVFGSRTAGLPTTT